MYIIVNTVHKSDDRDNNNKFTDRSLLKMLCSVHHFGISFAFKSHSEWQALLFMSNKFTYT